MKKKCYRCKEEKDISLFSKEHKREDGLTTKCKPCAAVLYKTWREKNKDTQKIKDRISYYISKYSLTKEEAIRLVEDRVGECLICKNKAPLVVDHCHTTGKVRGLICHACNSMLGYARDNTDTMLAGILYLKTHYEKD